MSVRRITAHRVPGPLRAGMTSLAQKLNIPGEFPAAVQEEARRVAASGPADGRKRADRTDIEFCSIDPKGSTDLDQALHIERRGSGYRVHYAIADVAAWVKPGGAIDKEARRRGVTHYAPSWRVPLHPPVLSEQAASLLADGQRRPAQLWTIDLDERGEVVDWTVERAWVLNRAQLDYQGVQRDLDDGVAHPSCALLAEVGPLRLAIEAERGGVSLNLPEQQVVDTDGRWTLEFRTPLPVEEWNAQISLLTGMCAAQTMLRAGVGILRTMPPADARDVDRLRATAMAMGVDWPVDWSYPEYVRSLDPNLPSHLAMMDACAGVFHGATYTPVGEDRGPKAIGHAALAAPYAHTTAPLRRLVDRYVGEICVDVMSGGPVSRWAVTMLGELPKIMAAADQRSRRFEKGIVSMTEALVLREYTGEVLEGSVVDVDTRKEPRAYISMPQVAAEVRVEQAGLRRGTAVTVRVEKADPATGEIRLAVL